MDITVALNVGDSRVCNSGECVGVYRGSDCLLSGFWGKWRRPKRKDGIYS
jgi:hypothetical protein